MPAPSKSGNPLQSLTKKAGPLPVWAWAVAVLIIFYVYSHRTSAVAAPASSSSPSITPAGAAGSSSAPPDLTSQLSGLGASLSDIAAGQSVLQGYDETLLAGQQAIWDSYSMPSSSVTAAHVGGTVNGSAVYNTAYSPPIYVANQINELVGYTGQTNFGQQTNPATNVTGPVGNQFAPSSSKVKLA